MADALKDSGANSQCFSNLFQRTLGRYREPSLLLPLIRQEMYKATMEFQPGRLSHWQHLEELFLQQQESEQLNAQYRKEIESLAASLQIKASMVEDEEMARLLRTMAPEPLIAPKARLIIDLLRHPHPPQVEAFISHLMLQIWSEEFIPDLNMGAYVNKEVEDLFAQGGKPPCDKESRQKVYDEIQRILAEDAPYIFLFQSKSYAGINKRIGSIVPTPLGIVYNLEEWYVKPEEP